jgi:ribosomal protein L37E
MDNLIICERCGSDACYVQEVNQDIKNYQCYGCGFITNSLMKKDSQFLMNKWNYFLTFIKN